MKPCDWGLHDGWPGQAGQLIDEPAQQCHA